MLTHYTEAAQWAVLAMEPDTDVRNIKRAYARRLKVVRPDDDAAAFQELRAAYEWALELAAYLASLPPEAEVEVEAEREPEAELQDMPEAAMQQPVHADTYPQMQRDTVVIVAHAPTAESLHVAESLHTSENPETQRQPASIVLQPSLDFPYRPEQPAFLTPREAWQMAGQLWQDFVKDSLEHNEPVEVQKNQLAAVTQALKDMLRSDDMEPLIARTELHHFAIHYCADENAAPLIRLACLAAFRWEEERDYLQSYTAAPAWLAVNRAIADQQYEEMFVSSVLTESDKLLLEPGPPRIRWRKFYSGTFRNELAQTLNEIRTKKRELEIYRIGTPKLEAWAEVVFRPWPKLGAYLWSLAIGYFLASLGVLPLQETGWPAKLKGALFVLIWILPVMGLLAYPRFIYPLRQRLDTRMALGFNTSIVQGEQSQYRVWLAHVALSLLGFALLYLPPGFSDAFIAAGCTAALANMVVRYGINVPTLINSLAFMLLSGISVVGAMTPFLQDRAFFAMVLAPGLLMAAPVAPFRLYGESPHDKHSRLILLLTGLAVLGLQLLMGFYLPLPAAIIGWCWVVLAAQACDLSFRFVAVRWPGRAGALLWMLCTFGVFYFPWAAYGYSKAHVEWSVGGMLRLQASLMMGLLIGLTQNLIAEHKAARES
ncbi:hypothetical protein [Undibacterium sp.]|uniref:hypothetical protein n=1 Tax=Undibacterium sp. TaxID=1914977 RepID=UPI00374D0D0E